MMNTILGVFLLFLCWCAFKHALGQRPRRDERDDAGDDDDLDGGGDDGGGDDGGE